MHISLKSQKGCEFITVEPFNPLISKCQIKVCYVGEEPNRNGSIITKDTAKEMAKSLPGSPIVGFYNEKSQDFEEHSRDFEIVDGKFEIRDITRPYGFVDFNAKIWFETFYDDGVEHEYLCTEGWLWTGQYPECERILKKGNNQSMELDEKTLKAEWAKKDKSEPKFFIINEAIISKLCILGEDFEPCFEGASITNLQFSFDDNFKNELSSMITELNNLLNGGSQMFTKYSVTVGDSLWNSLYAFSDEKFENSTIVGVFEEEGQKFAVIQNEDNLYRVNFDFDEDGNFVQSEEIVGFESEDSLEPQFDAEEVAAFEAEFKKNKEEKEEDEDKKEDSKEEEKEDEPQDEDSEDEEKKKKAKKYSLEEIPEYVELAKNYAALERTIVEMNEKVSQLEEANAALVTFKKEAERKDKEAMIDSFYMLGEEDKQEVRENIDSYSLDDIEAKLSIICVRNKVSFDLDEEKEESNNEPTVYNLGSHVEENSGMAPWMVCVMETAKRKNN